MGWLKERWDTFKCAAGIRWEIIGILVAIFIGRVDWLYKQYLQFTNQPSKEDQMIFGFPSWILGLTVFLGFATIWLLEYSVKLRNQIKALTEPKIKIHDPFYWTEPKNALGKALRTYRLRISNLSGELIKHCQVKLIDMVNKNNEPTREGGLSFKLSIENPPAVLNAPLTQSFNIAPFDSKVVDIVRFNETKPDIHIHLCYATQGPIDLNVYTEVPVGLCPHNLTIRAIAENSMPVDRQFKFYVDEHGILQFEGV